MTTPSAASAAWTCLGFPQATSAHDRRYSSFLALPDAPILQHGIPEVGQKEQKHLPFLRFRSKLDDDIHVELAGGCVPTAIHVVSVGRTRLPAPRRFCLSGMKTAGRNRTPSPPPATAASYRRRRTWKSAAPIQPRQKPHRPRNAAPVPRPTAPRPSFPPGPAICDPARHRPSPAPGHRGGRGVRTRRSTAPPGSGARGRVGRGSRRRSPAVPPGPPSTPQAAIRPRGARHRGPGNPWGWRRAPARRAARPPVSTRLAKPLMSDPHQARPVRRICAGRCSRNTPTPIPSMTRGCRRRSTSRGASSGFSGNSRTR